MSEQERKQNDFYVVVISKREERDLLKSLCVKHNIPLMYPELFDQEQIQPLWGINDTGVGLIGTLIARYTPKDHIICSIENIGSIFVQTTLKNILN